MSEAQSPGILRQHPVMIGLAALVLLLIGTWLVIDKICEGKLAAEINKIRRAHEPLTMEEVEALRPQLPDDENMATGLLQAGKAISQFEQSDKFKSEIDKLPIIGSLLPLTHGVRLSGEPLRASKAFLSAISTAIEDATTASRLSGGHYNVTWQPNPMDTPLQYQSLHRSVVKSICLLAMVEISEKHKNNAAQALLTGLRLDRAMSLEPNVIGALVRAASIAVVNTAICKTISIDALDDSELGELQHLLAEIEETWSLRTPFLGERAYMGSSLSYAYANAGGGLAATFGSPIAAIRALPGVQYLDQAAIYRLMSDVCTAASLDPLAAIQRIRAVNAAAKNLPSYCVGASIMAPNFERTFQLWFRELGEIRATRAALAAERYRLARGGWPESLEALVPRYLDAVPNDPFDDKPLRYARDARGIRIWSVGEDGVDNGGEIIGYSGEKRPRDDGAYLVEPSARGQILPAVTGASSKAASD